MNNKADQGIAANQLDNETEEKDYLVGSIPQRLIAAHSDPRTPGGVRRHSQPGHHLQLYPHRDRGEGLPPGVHLGKIAAGKKKRG